MTDASSVSSMTRTASRLTKADSDELTLWERLTREPHQFGNPGAFNNCIAQSWRGSFTVTPQGTDFFDAMREFYGDEAGTGDLMTFNWLMSIVLPQPNHFF
jgi:oleate hydratase